MLKHQYCHLLFYLFVLNIGMATTLLFYGFVCGDMCAGSFCVCDIGYVQL